MLMVNRDVSPVKYVWSWAIRKLVRRVALSGDEQSEIDTLFLVIYSLSVME